MSWQGVGDRKQWVRWAGGALLATSLALAQLTTTACSGSSAGHGGSGAVDPDTANVLRVHTTLSIGKADVLFVVDNSSSMADKQQLLAQAARGLLQRFQTPLCVRPCTEADNCSAQQQYERIPTGSRVEADGTCAEGMPEFPPFQDIHVGVISSSLGSHGAGASPQDACLSVSKNDHAQLLGALRPGLESYDNQGFLAWDPRGRYHPAGDGDAAAFADKTEALILSAGEAGCDYEATLEAWYRFLVDPEPPVQVLLDQTMTRAMGVDQTVLDQRSRFLRHDSLVFIIVLSDENDCSIMDEGYGWLVSRATPMYRSTSACASSPNDSCCSSCAEGSSGPGCPAPSDDPACQAGATLPPGPEDDPRLRCWDQKRRFGMDLLYPIARYSEALSSFTVPQRSTGAPAPNPLFTPLAGGAPRDKSMVRLATIVGVPWQDIADEESLTGPGLRFQPTNQLTIESVWDAIIGDPQANPPVPPTDALMLETPDDRSLLNNIHFRDPSLLPRSSTSENPLANAANGHEHVNVDGGDLQYACIFPLAEPRVCDQAARDAGVGCDCFEEDIPANRPVCQPPEGGPASITQYFAKAYPGTRFLQLARDHGDFVTLGSICPKLVDEGSPDYGYNPSVNAIVRDVLPMFEPRCFPEPLPLTEEGTIACRLFHAFNGYGFCPCAEAGWDPVAANSPLERVVLETLEEDLACGTQSGIACSAMCVCSNPRHTGADLRSCTDNVTPDLGNGFCYVSAESAEPNIGNPDLVEHCPEGQKRRLVITGSQPSQSTRSLLVCPNTSDASGDSADR